MSRKLLASTAALLGLLGAGLAAPALADGNNPPVTVDDDVYVLQGSLRLANLAANDTDDAPGVAVCRVAKTAGIVAFHIGNTAAVVAADPETLVSSDAGDYPIAYQACDHDYLSIGHATVHVDAPQSPTVTKTSDPGILTIHNPNPVPIIAAWGDPTAKRADGRLRVAPDGDAQFTVTRHQVTWIAGDPWAFTWDGLVGQGEVSGISLPATARPTTATVPWRTSSITPRVRRAVREGSSAQADWPADPTTVQPPTPQPDTITWWAGSAGTVKVLGNDTDPAGQHLSVCRTDGTPYGSRVSLANDSGHLFVGTGNHLAASRIVHYGVCNDGRIAQGTLTVVTRRAKPLVVWRSAAHPRRVHVRNPNDARAVFLIKHGSGMREMLMFQGYVPAGATRTFQERLRAFSWQGVIGPRGGFAGRGKVATAQ